METAKAASHSSLPADSTSPYPLTTSPTSRPRSTGPCPISKAAAPQPSLTPHCAWRPKGEARAMQLGPISKWNSDLENEATTSLMRLELEHYFQGRRTVVMHVDEFTD